MSILASVKRAEDVGEILVKVSIWIVTSMDEKLISASQVGQ